MAAGDGQAGAAQLGLQLGRRVDAHVAADALRCVVLVAEHPVDLLREPRRHGRRERAAGLEDADQLGDRGGVGLDVLEHLAGDHAVERCRRRTAVAWRRPAGRRPTRSSAISPASAIAANVALVCCHFVGRVVEGDDVGALAGQRERVTSEAGTGVEHEVARPDAELIESDRQHVRSRPFRRNFSTLCGMASTSRYCSTVSCGAVPPAPALDHSTSAGVADPRSQLGVVETAPNDRHERVDIAGPALQHRVAVAPGHFGQRAAVGGNQADACRHRFDRRKAETFVQARHDGELGLGVELDDALVGHAADELDVRHAGRADRCRSLLAPSRGLPMMVQRHVALGAQLGHRLEQVRQALQGDVGRCGGDQPAGLASDVRQRREQLGIDTDRHEAHAVEADAHVGVDVVDRVLADDDDARHAAGDAALHLHEVVPTADRVALAPGRRVGHLQGAVTGDRVVKRDDGRDESSRCRGCCSRGTGCRARGRSRAAAVFSS